MIETSTKLDKVKNLSHQVRGGGVIGLLSDHTQRIKLPRPCLRTGAFPVGGLGARACRTANFSLGLRLRDAFRHILFTPDSNGCLQFRSGTLT